MKGKPFSMVGLPTILEPLARGIGRLPEGIRKQLYALGGLQEGISPDKLDQVDDAGRDGVGTRTGPAASPGEPGAPAECSIEESGDGGVPEMGSQTGPHRADGDSRG